MICSEIFTKDSATDKAENKYIVEEEEYQKLRDIDKSKRCTGNYEKTVCNKVRHCCYWEYKDPDYNEFLPVCYNFDVFKKYYVRDVGAYTLKINQSGYRADVRENNLCNLLISDDQFPEVRKCSCLYIEELGKMAFANTLKASMFLLTIIAAFLSLM